MKPFAYSRPGSLPEAVATLARDPDARPLAGGMTLLPTMKLRLATPSHLIDLAEVPALRGITVAARTLVVGAMTRHADVAASAEVRQHLPALASLAAGIGDPQVRNRGTMGGSIVNNDPAADYPAALVALDARVLTNRRAVPAESFFLGMFQTALEPAEIVTAIEIPFARAAGYEKFRSPASRFALVGVFIARGSDGTRVAVTGAGPCVFRATAIEPALDASFSVEALDTIRIPSAGLNTDMHGDAQFRAHLIMVLARRAVGRLLASQAEGR